MREEIISKWKLKIVFVENNWNRSYSIEWLKRMCYWISEKRMNSIIEFYWKEKLIELLEIHRDFNKIQLLFDDENSLDLTFEEFENFNNSFSWVLTNEMLEIFDFLEPFRKNYYLSWWTAISLYLKHRESIDFDIFSNWNNIDLNKLREHILSYKKFKVFWKTIWNNYEEINETNILDLVNNNEEVHLKINWVTVDITDYSRRLSNDEWSYMNCSYNIDWFILKVPTILELWWAKIWALSTRLKNKDIEDIRFIMKNHWYSLKDLLDSYISVFWRNLIFYWYLDLLNLKTIKSKYYENIVWLWNNNWLSDEELLILVKEYWKELLKIIWSDVKKYLRDIDLEQDNEIFKDQLEKRYKEHYDFYKDIVEWHRIYKENNSLKNKMTNFFKNLFKK